MAIADIPPVTDTALDIVELRHKRRESALTQLVVAAHRHGVVRDDAALIAALLRRERLGSTALGKGVAVSHARSVAVAKPFYVLGRSARGLDWPAPDAQAVNLVVLLLTPAEMSADAHLERLASAAASTRLQRTRHKLLESDAATALALLRGAPS